ncbi:MAG TPA: tetratricopeptide repeat protein [Candidatus Obscuribacterales bacterium]
MHSDSHKTLWQQYEHAALFARKQGNLGKATRILREALRESEDYGELSCGLIEQAHALAYVYLNQYRFADAESLFRLVLEVREKLYGQTHDDVVDSLKKVAIVQIMAFRAEALGRKTTCSPMPWSESVAAAS